MQRKSAEHNQASAVPPIVHDTLRAPGQPLDVNTRAFMEPRFAHDFSGVRVHADALAADSARAVQAHAYTVGNHIVFGSGQYAPETPTYSRLLAHELTHVVQQGIGGGTGPQYAKTVSHPSDAAEIEAEAAADRVLSGSSVQVRQPPSALVHSLSTGAAIGISAGVVGGAVGLGLGIAALAGAFDRTVFSDAELQAYLSLLTQTRQIENKRDSDNKARAVVMRWRLGGSPFVLTAQQKILLIKEMLSGVTGDDDEQAILEVLERSYNFELRMIFGTVNVSELNSSIHGEEWERLQSFYSRRFDGGMEAMLKGIINPIDYPIPLGTLLPKIGETGIPLEQLPGAEGSWNEECVTGILCTQDQDVIAQLPSLTILKTPQVTEFYWEYDGASWNLKTKDHAAFSNSKKKIIGFKLSSDCGFAAAAMVHEVRHQNQSQAGDIVRKEKDAYTFEENWTIQRGIPGRSRFRMPKPGGGEQVNVPEVEKYVIKRYSGATATPGEQIIDHAPDGKTEIIKPDGTTYLRAPQAGDSHQDFPKTDQALSNAPKADASKWVCPITK